MKLITLLSTITLLILVSCEKSIQNFEVKEASPKLVLNSFCNKNDYPRIHITQNMGFLENGDFHQQVDATVELYENGSLIRTLASNGENWYSDNSMSLKTGKDYSYQVRAKGFPDVEASFTIPEAIKIISIDTHLINMPDPEVVGGEKNNYLHYKIAFENAPEINEYFSIEVTSHTEDTYGSPLEPDYLPDTSFTNTKVNIYSNSLLIETILTPAEYYENPVATEKISSGIKFYISDKYSKSRIDTIIIDARVDQYSIYDTNLYTLKISSMEEAMFKYVTSRRKSTDTPLVEPTSIYSNVENGLGIVTGFNTFSFTCDVSHYNKDRTEDESYY